MNLRFAAGIGEECRLDKLPGLWARLAIRLAATAAVSLLLLFGFSAHTSAQIILDGNLTEPDWKLLSQRSDGPSPGFGAGHEINALYADLDSSGLFIGVAGNVLWGTTGNRILVFIDSKPGGYNTGNFGRAGAPQGIDDFNELSSFDLDFFPDYVLVIGTDAANPNGAIPALANYYWDLYTLSSTADSDVGGGPNLPLGGKTDPDLGANPPVPGPTTNYLQGFETRLTYSQSGAGVDIAIDQPVIKFFAAYISDGGYLSNQFITPAFPTDGNYTDGQVNFAVAVPNPVDFAGYIVINEFDVDQPGEDNREFIELKNISNIPINLDPYSLRLVNGTGGGAAIYRTIDLPNVVLNPGQYYVVCGIPSNVANCNLDATPDVDLLENAVPSAIALVYPNSDTIIDTVSYGGSTVAPYTEGTGISPGDDDVTVGIGLSRLPDGADTNRNSIDFSRRCITPGQTNTTDNINCTGGGGTATPTPTTTTTVTPIPTLPAGCVDILVAGGFELDGGWHFAHDPIPGKYVSLTVHSGLRAVQLGNPRDGGGKDKVSYSSVRQLVKIPGNAITVQLRWWHQYRTEEATDEDPYSKEDRQEVILLTPGGKTIKILQRVRRDEAGWTEDAIDLTEFRGKSVYIYFNVFNDKNSSRTWAYIDDVMLDVCFPDPTATPPATNTPTITPTPTNTPTPTSTDIMTGTPTATATSTSTVTDTDDVDVEALRSGLPLGVIPSTGTPVLVAPVTELVPVPVTTPIPGQEAAPPLAALPGLVTLPIAPAATAPVIEPSQCIELVNNGKFEALGPGWNLLAGEAQPLYVSDITFNRSERAIQLGIIDGPNRKTISAVDQTVLLPETASSIILSFRYFPLFDAEPGPGDLQYVDIYNGLTNQFAGRALGIQGNDRLWLAKDFDLTALAGQPIRLVFAVNNDGVEGRTAMYVDNVSIMACNYNPSPAPILTSALTPVNAARGSDTDLDLTPTPLVDQTTEPTRLADDSASTSNQAALDNRDSGPSFAGSRGWLARLGTIAVLIGILGVIGFVALVIIGTIQPTD